MSRWITNFELYIFLGATLCYGTQFQTPYEESSGSSVGERWGYVRTRPEVSLFWWLYETTHPAGYLKRPLVIWLQGGPGISGTGLGNFGMFGPVDHEGNHRNENWVSSASMLYVDSPAGTGYSYLHAGATPPRTCDHVSQDLVAWMHVFLQHNTEFREVPIYIFGQSYGGKMGPNFAYHLEQARKYGAIHCNLRGVAIGNGWTSPITTTAGWPDFLLYMSLIDSTKHQELQGLVAEMLEIDRGEEDEKNYSRLAELYWQVDQFSQTHIDPYNVLNPGRSTIYDLDLHELMNGPIREHLGIIPSDVTWDSMRDDASKVFTSFLESHDFLRSEVHLVDALLKHSDVQVIIYSGQLDIVCSTKGAIDWVQSLAWEGMDAYNASNRSALLHPDTGREEMFVRAHDRLKFYWVLNAGHAVPEDVPDTALRMLNRIIEDVDN